MVAATTTILRLGHGTCWGASLSYKSTVTSAVWPSAAGHSCTLSQGSKSDSVLWDTPRGGLQSRTCCPCLAATHGKGRRGACRRLLLRLRCSACVAGRAGLRGGLLRALRGRQRLEARVLRLCGRASGLVGAALRRAQARPGIARQARHGSHRQHALRVLPLLPTAQARASHDVPHAKACFKQHVAPRSHARCTFLEATPGFKTGESCRAGGGSAIHCCRNRGI